MISSGELAKLPDDHLDGAYVMIIKVVPGYVHNGWVNVLVVRSDGSRSKMLAQRINGKLIAI